MITSGNLACQDQYREELIGGRVVAMSPRPAYNHNRTASNIFRLFADHLDNRKCEAIADGTDLYLTEEDRFVPDVMVVCDPDKLQHDGVHGAPDLVVEVLSPGTAKNDRMNKKDVYAKCGVREYWLVDPVSKSIEIYLNDGSDLVLRETYMVYPDWMQKNMSETERSGIVTRFKCSLYDDLELSLSDIFKGLLP